MNTEKSWLSNGWWFALLAAGMMLGTLGSTAGAADAEKVAITLGQMKVVEPPFVVKGFRVTDQDIVKCETIGERQLRIMGVKVGASDVQVTGEDGASALYAVTVIENIKEIMTAMKKDLDGVPEVDLSVNRDRVVLKGEVSSIEHWELMQKVLTAYEKQYLNLVTFRPAPEVMMGLKAALEKVGFKVLQDQDPTQIGVLGVKFSGNAVFVNGRVYTPKDVERITQVVAAQDWLTLKKDQEKGAVKVPAVLNVVVEPVMIEVDIVYVGFNDIQSQQIGVNLAKEGLIAVDTTAAGFSGILGKGGSWGGNYSFNSGLQGVLNFMANNGVKRFRNAGHLTFKSNDSPQWKLFQSGGTLKVKIAGTNNTTGSLQDIDYGLIMRVRGGLSDAKVADLEVELELSAPELQKNGDYDLKRNRVNTSVTCEIGKTMAIGGMKDLVQNTTGPSGVPFLRSIPVVQWFFSEQQNSMVNSQVLILISAQLAGAPRPSVPVSQETMDTEIKVQQTNQERMKENRKGKRFFFF